MPCSALNPKHLEHHESVEHTEQPERQPLHILNTLNLTYPYLCVFVYSLRGQSSWTCPRIAAYKGNAPELRIHTGNNCPATTRSLALLVERIYVAGYACYGTFAVRLTSGSFKRRIANAKSLAQQRHTAM